MAIYLFKCSNKKCAEQSFDFVMSMNSYSDTISCPTCGKPAHRNLAEDFKRYKIMPMGEPRTLGMLAEKNNRTYSKDEKAAILAKHTAYRREKIPLSERNVRMPGMSYLDDKRKNVGKGQEEKFKARKSKKEK